MPVVVPGDLTSLICEHLSPLPPNHNLIHQSKTQKTPQPLKIQIPTDTETRNQSQASIHNSKALNEELIDAHAGIDGVPPAEVALQLLLPHRLRGIVRQ